MSAEINTGVPSPIVSGYAAIVPADERNSDGEVVMAWALPGGRITYSMDEAKRVADRMAGIMKSYGVSPQKETVMDAIATLIATSFPLNLSGMYPALGGYETWTDTKKRNLKTLRQCLAAA